MTEIVITSSDQKKKDDVPIHPGLFEFPAKTGQRPALLANRCSQCGQSFFPRRMMCPFCFENGRMEQITLDTRGFIYAATVVHLDSPSGIKAPYAYGYVDIPVNNIRIFALFTGDDPSSFNSGRQVELVLESVRTEGHGQKIIGYKFKPLDNRDNP